MRGLLIGRFQPFHAGHLAVVQALRAARPAEPLVLGIGSAQASYTRENPFTGAERFAMIEAALEEAQVGSCVAVPIPDIHRHALWVGHVRSLVPPFDRVYTNNPLTRTLFEKEGIAVEAPALVDRARFEGTQVRARMASGAPWHDRVPPAVARYLDAIGGPARLRLLLASPDAVAEGSAEP
jgi:nicotinamide-nucleotide adenylyltransferase